MIALLALLGIGLIAGIAGGGSDGEMLPADDSDDSGDPEAEGPVSEAAPRQFDDDGQAIVAASERVSLEDFLAGSGATAEAQSDILAETTFLTGPFNLDTGGGSDTVVGSDGDDNILTGTENDQVTGGLGDDVIQLEDGNDVYGRAISQSAGPAGSPSFDLGGGAAALQGGDDWVRGGLGDDIIEDGYGSDRLAGNQDNDIINAVDRDEGNPDHVLGGFGNDTLFVDEGDLVDTGRGVDRVFVNVEAGIASDYDPVTISEFTPLVDKVDLLGFDSSQVAVADSADGESAVISVGGVPVVIVIGGQGLNAFELGVSDPVAILG